MRPFYLRFWALFLACALTLTPAAALAQQLSPGARSAISNGAAAGAALVSLSSVEVAPVAVGPEVDEPEVDEPEVDEPEVDEPEVDEPEVDEPEVDEPEVDEPEVDEPEVDEVVEVVEDEPATDDDSGPVTLSGDWIEYENAGITLAAPAEWDVLAMSMFDSLFSIEIPGSEFVGLVQGGDSLDFPGVMAVMIMRTLPEFIVAQFGEGAVLIDTETFVTVQDLPIVKISFVADLEGTLMGGAFYVISPGATAYIAIALALPEQWFEIEETFDALATSITFEPSLISLIGPEDDIQFVVDVDETLEIVLPEFWLAAATGDPALPILTVSPGYEFVAALTADQTYADDVNELLDQALGDGEVNDEIIDLVMDLLNQSMDLDQEAMSLDPSLSEVFVIGNELVIRMVGAIEIDVDVALPVAIYVGLRTDGISALIVFGDIDAALDAEDTLIDLLDSLLFIRP